MSKSFYVLYQAKLCVKKPFAIRTFASFVIDLKLRDLAADDNGVW